MEIKLNWYRNSNTLEDMQLLTIDWAAVNFNLNRARMAWGRLVNILLMEKAEPKVMTMIYKVVIQAVDLIHCAMRL